MIEVQFEYNNSTISLHCNESDIINDIFLRNTSKEGLDINKIFFLYGGKTINGQLAINKLINDSENENKIINILVYDIEENYKKSDNIICSICKGICNLEIKDYKIQLSECENGHIINDILINDFNKTQLIDESTIICDKCKFKNKHEAKQFYNCNVCNQALCESCKNIHDKSHNIIDYDKKNYICKSHNEKFISYCVNCKKNLCFSCEIKHNKNHTINSYKNIIPDKEAINNIKNKFQEKFKIFNENIGKIVQIMNILKENISKFNEIFCDIFNNYEMENRNNHILKNINAIMNNEIFYDIMNICNIKNIYSQIKLLLQMYKKMNIYDLSDESIKDPNEIESEYFKKVKYSNLKETQLLYKYGENSMCKLEGKFNNKKIEGIGFFVQIEKNFGIPFNKALFTCYHILPEELLKQNNFVHFNHKGIHKNINIKESLIFSANTNYLDVHKGFDKRKIFINKELDYTFIEILDTDKIFEQEYELFKMDLLNSIDSSDITILHYPNLEGLSFSLGNFIKKDNDNLYHNCYIELKNDGAPIINRKENKYIIGIHYGKKNNFGLGHFIEKISCDIKMKYIELMYKENTLNNNFKTLKYHKDYIINIISLDDKTLCSCSRDGTLIIFDLYTFEILGLINEKKEIIYHTKLSNNNIILCCKNGTLKIYKEKSQLTMDNIKKIFSGGINYNVIQTITGYKKPSKKEYELFQTLKGHEGEVCQVIEINENTIISCGLDGKIKIWKNNKKDMNFYCVKTLTSNEKKNFPINILKINENEIVSATTKANYIIFWDLNTFTEFKKIENIICSSNRNSMKMINATTLCIGGDLFNGIYLINKNNYQVTSLLKGNTIFSVSTVIRLPNGNILTGCQQVHKSEEEAITYSYSLIEYKYNNSEKSLTKVREKDNAHKNIITGILSLNNNEIISCSLDQEIKLWI